MSFAGSSYSGLPAARDATCLDAGFVVVVSCCFKDGRLVAAKDTHLNRHPSAPSLSRLVLPAPLPMVTHRGPYGDLWRPMGAHGGPVGTHGDPWGAYGDGGGLIVS